MENLPDKFSICVSGKNIKIENIGNNFYKIFYKNSEIAKVNSNSKTLKEIKKDIKKFLDEKN